VNNRVNHAGGCEGPKSSKQIADMIGDHMAMCGEMKSGEIVGKQLVEAFQMDDYKRAVHELLQEVIVERLLEPRIVDHYLEIIARMNTQEQKDFFEPGHKCCATLVPVSNKGLPLDEQKQVDGKYLRFMVIDEFDVSKDNFAWERSFLYKMQPEEIQADLADGGCTFYILPTDEPVHIVQKARQAIENLKGWLR